MRRRRGITLLLVLVSLVLLVALVAPLATYSGTVALESAHHTATLRHRLAVDSLVAVWPQLLAQDAQIKRQLGKHNRALVTLDLGGLRVEALVQDDTAKLPVPLLLDQEHQDALAGGLTVLQARLPLPSLGDCLRSTAEDWQWGGCLDDLFEEPTDGGLYGRLESATVWAQFTSPVGRVIHAYRAHPAVLEAALCDLRPGLGLELARRREMQSRRDLDALLGELELEDTTLSAARSRLTTTTKRYSLLVRTRLGHDVRQRYLLCTADRSPRVLLDWEVAP